MTDRAKWLLVGFISLVALGGAAVVGILAWQQYQSR